MEGWSVAMVTAKEKFVGRQEHCSCGRQLPEGRGARGGRGVERRRGSGEECRMQRRRGQGKEGRVGRVGEREGKAVEGSSDYLGGIRTRVTV